MSFLVKCQSSLVFGVVRITVLDGGDLCGERRLLMSVKVCLAPFLRYRYSL